MERTLNRKANLVTFSADIDQVDALVSRLISMFDRGSHAPSISISADAKGENFSFDDFSDLRATQGLPPQFTEFRISLRGRLESEQYGYVSIAVTRFGSEVSATGPTPGWCAGVIAEVVHFAKQNHKWMPAAKFSRSYLAVVIFGLIVSFGLSPPVALSRYFSPAFIWVWGGVVLALLAIILVSYHIPLAILRISGAEPWWRRYKTELTLLLSSLALIVSVIALWH